MAEKQSNGKSPYELRFDILAMSKDYFDRVNDINVSFAQQAFHTAVEQGKATYEQWEKFAPKTYGFDEVIAKAQELYGFVAKKD